MMKHKLYFQHALYLERMIDNLSESVKEREGMRMRRQQDLMKTTYLLPRAALSASQGLH